MKSMALSPGLRRVRVSRAARTTLGANSEGWRLEAFPCHGRGPSFVLLHAWLAPCPDAVNPVVRSVRGRMTAGDRTPIGCCMRH